MVNVMMYPCMFCVAMSMDLFVLCGACLTVFVTCLVKQFAICLGVFAILLLNVMELLCVVGGALLDRPCIERLCCACGSSDRLDVPSICFVSMFVCRKLSPHLGACSSYVGSFCDFAC